MTQTSRVPTVTGEWECTECGFIVEGMENRRPSSCPECDAPAEALEFFAYDDEVDEVDEDWEEDEDEYEEDDDELDDDYDDVDVDDEFEDDEDY